ncbi:hypothetical protein NDU88_001447 [Pleurodeles waltl]|uniref:Uncharacterized protein n=1 Tax=Pleurodeles waltl TaxID=8319 RepID=A0AAV7THV7_PLEWA|nr:hypothetical protein NDU88_001447 [Pleurodeles waltl]
MVGMSAVVPLSEDVTGPLAVLAVVSVVAVLAAESVAAVVAAGSVVAVLAAGSVAMVLAAGSVAVGMCQHLLREKAGCPTGKRLGTVAAAVDVPEAVQVPVQVAVFATVQVGVDVDRRCDTGPSVCATIPSPDLPFCFLPFPTFDGGAVVLPLSPFVFADPLVAGVFGFSLRDVGTFFTLAGGGMSLPSLRGTLEALMVGALHDPAVAGTTVPGDVVAEVLGWYLESRALGEGQGGNEGKRSRFDRKCFLDTLGRVDGGGSEVEEEVVVVGGVRLLNLGEGAWAGGCCEVDGYWVGVCLRLCTLGGGLTDTLEEEV